MSTKTTIGYAAAGVIVAASTITATLATFGLGGEAAATTDPVATAGAAQAVVTTPGGSAIPLAPGEQIAGTEIVQTPAGPVEYVYVTAAPARAHDDDDDDEHEDREGSRDHDDDDEGRGHEQDDRKESRSAIRGERR